MEEKEEMCDLKNMRQVLEMLEKRMEGKRLFRYMAGEQMIDVSAEEFFHAVKYRACSLQKKKMCGKHIGIIGENSYEWMVSFCAIFWTGSVAVLLNRQSDAETVKELAERVDLDALLYDISMEEVILSADLQEQVELLPMQNFCVENEMSVEKDSQAVRESDDLACIFFTSGTTDKSKAVMISSRGLVASVCCNVNNKPFHSLLAVLPFHHMSGFVMVLNAIYLGAEICLAGDLKYFYRYLRDMKPDYVPVVPSMLPILVRKLKNGGIHGERLGWNLHMVHCGGAAFLPEFLQIFLQHDIMVLQGYGASEAGGIGFMWEMTPDRPDTIGKPPAQMQVKIVERELFLKSESVMMGYYGDEKGTELVLRDGWYATGDLCREDEEGYLYLTGRKKNLIILSNGENVSPEEIETKLYCCKEIREVMVGAEKDMLMAAVYPEYPLQSDEHEQKAIRKKIERFIELYNYKVPMYKQIRQIHFMEEPFAKTAVGKMIRKSVTGGMNRT